jgi:hypothetical protein
VKPNLQSTKSLGKPAEKDLQKAGNSSRFCNKAYEKKAYKNKVYEHLSFSLCLNNIG